MMNVSIEWNFNSWGRGSKPYAALVVIIVASDSQTLDIDELELSQPFNGHIRTAEQWTIYTAVQWLVHRPHPGPSLMYQM